MASLEIILERSTRAYSEQEKLEMTEIKNNWYREMIEQLRPDEILPGVIDFLNSLKMNGIKCAICSASKSAAFIIDKLGITQYFDTIVGGQDITKSKPDPEVFLVAAERLNTLPAECVVFEDAYAGIEGAKRAGMKAVGLGDPNILTNADIVCKDMTEITLEKVMKLFQ